MSFQEDILLQALRDIVDMGQQEMDKKEKKGEVESTPKHYTIQPLMAGFVTRPNVKNPFNKYLTREAARKLAEEAEKTRRLKVEPIREDIINSISHIIMSSAKEGNFEAKNRSFVVNQDIEEELVPVLQSHVNNSLTELGYENFSLAFKRGDSKLEVFVKYLSW